jgi:hypothetical protein
MSINAIPDIPRLYTALAEWLSCLLLVILLKPRIKKKKIALFSAIYLVLLIIFFEITANVWLGLWIPCMIAAFLSMAGFIHLCTRVDKNESIYYAILAFSTAELMASLEWQIVNNIYIDISKISIFEEIAFLIVIYFLILLLIFRLFKERMSMSRHIDIGRSDKRTAVFIAIIVFGFSNLRFITEDFFVPGQYSREIANARTLIDIAGVSILYAHYVLCYNNAVLRELDAVQSTLQTQYQQYKQSRESIEVINMKYHDMKHQIQFLKNEQDPVKRNEFLDRMENEIKSFELQNKTGNAILDTILTGKSLYCYKHGITMTSVADGKLLDFMDVVDICNIFGNALDNAIESVMRIEDKEKRLIHVTVSKLNDFVMIRIENYYEGSLFTDGSDYITTKSDKKYHGYGIKSIKYTADRYEGAVYINTDNNWFDIKIVIPNKN